MSIQTTFQPAASHRWQRTLLVSVLIAGVTIVGCSGGDENACGGIIEPVRVLTPSPASLTLDVGADVQVAASLSGGCSSDSRAVQWTTSDAQVATVDGTGKVTAVGGGNATVTATAFDNKARTTIPVTVRPRAATTLDARPDVDTLSPLGTRVLTATVRDQRNTVITAAPVVWRSLTPNLATVSVSGTVAAIAAGTANIEASTPRVGADSLRDTVRILIVTACSLVRPIQLGTSVNGTIDTSTCENFLGYRVANQYSLTAAAQTYYAIRLTSTIPTALVPLVVNSALYGLPVADTAVRALGVIRAGTFGILVTAPAQTPGTFTLTTEVNPDPRTTCVTTDVSTDVAFNTAITPTCASRDIRILPAIAARQVVRITAAASSFPVEIELRNTAGSLIQRAVAGAAGATATIAFTNGTTARSGILRVIGSAGANDLVAITIAP
jgi:hypothetical protein